jgi:hypothetical protein
MTPLFQLEQYTLKHRQEVLLVTATLADEREQVMVFRGFSSSLMRSTASDPDVPVLPEDAEILAIDRLHAPYDLSNPRYIQQGLTWDEMRSLLQGMGL